MCYAQIGGLTVATFITLLLVPVIYAIFVYDLKIVPWKSNDTSPTGTVDGESENKETTSNECAPSLS
jgi:hypothetical protein